MFHVSIYHRSNCRTFNQNVSLLINKNFYSCVIKKQNKKKHNYSFWIVKYTSVCYQQIENKRKDPGLDDNQTPESTCPLYSKECLGCKLRLLINIEAFFFMRYWCIKANRNSCVRVMHWLLGTFRLCGLGRAEVSQSLCTRTQGCESVCEKKSEIIWNAWIDKLFQCIQTALKVWQLVVWRAKKV